MAKRLSQMIRAKKVPIDTKLCAIKFCEIGSYDITPDAVFNVTHIDGDYLRVKQLHPKAWHRDNTYDHTIDSGRNTERLRLAYKNGVRKC